MHNELYLLELQMLLLMMLMLMLMLMMLNRRHFPSLSLHLHLRHGMRAGRRMHVLALAAIPLRPSAVSVSCLLEMK